MDYSHHSMPNICTVVVIGSILELIFRHRGIVAESAAAAMVAAAKIQGAGLATIGLAGAGKLIFSNVRSSVRTRC
jgi:hypothetical protein